MAYCVKCGYDNNIEFEQYNKEMGKVNSEKERLERLEKWQSEDPEYRKQIVRELEANGSVLPMDNKSFGSIVYG